MGPNCLGTADQGRGGQWPVIKNPDMVSPDTRTRGGTMTVGIPPYVMTVVNEPEPNAE